MAEISAIVPIYKAEEYINRCIDSLINQTFKDIEIILVNDGSPDKCGEIANDYQEKDSRIKVIHKDNGGVSKARNVGIQCATGKYVVFVDPDDWIELDMYENMYLKAEVTSCDMVICDYIVESTSLGAYREKFPFPQNKVLSGENIKKEILSYFIKSETCGTIWNKMYKRNIITKHNIKFPSEIGVGEDYLFNLEYLTYTNSLIYMPTPFYHYDVRQGSAMSKYWGNKFEMYNTIHNETMKYMQKWDMISSEYVVDEIKKYLIWVDVCIQEEFKNDNTKTILERIKHIKNIISAPDVCKSITALKNYEVDWKFNNKLMLHAIKNNNSFEAAFWGMVKQRLIPVKRLLTSRVKNMSS